MESVAGDTGLYENGRAESWLLRRQLVWTLSYPLERLSQQLTFHNNLPITHATHFLVFQPLIRYRVPFPGLQELERPIWYVYKLLTEADCPPLGRGHPHIPPLPIVALFSSLLPSHYSPVSVLFIVRLMPVSSVPGHLSMHSLCYYSYLSHCKLSGTTVLLGVC